MIRPKILIKNPKLNKVKKLNNIINQIGESMQDDFSEFVTQQINKNIIPGVKSIFDLFSAIKMISFSQSIYNTEVSSIHEFNEISVWLNEFTYSDSGQQVKRGIYRLSELKNNKIIYQTLSNLENIFRHNRNIFFILGNSVKIDFEKDKITIFDLEDQTVKKISI